MVKIKLEWVNTGWSSCQVENPQSRRVYLREESKQINHMVKRLNRNKNRAMFQRFLKTR